MQTVENTPMMHEAVDGIMRFVDGFVLPLEAENQQLLENSTLLYDERGGYSPAVVELIKRVRMTSSDAGYYTMFCPEEIGGGGLGSVPMVSAYEALYHRYGPGRLLPYEVLAHWTCGPSFLCNYMSDSLRESLLDGLVAGRVSMCFAMSEPDAGSDAWAMSTRAKPVAGGYLINGTKQWISNSPYADYAFVFAVTDHELRLARKGGVSCFVVSMNAPGVSIDSVIRLFGDQGGNEAILSFTDVFVSDEQLLGEINGGFSLALRGVGIGRTYNSARSVGMARWALEVATDYAKTRETFGRPISDYQAISFALADSAIDIHAARLMAFDLAERLDRGEPSVREMAMAKTFCVEACYRVYDRCMQICGGMGLTNEMRLFAGWHQARILRLADGSGEILRRTVAQRLLKGDIAF